MKTLEQIVIRALIGGGLLVYGFGLWSALVTRSPDAPQLIMVGLVCAIAEALLWMPLSG